jgi:DNA-binding transcriptional MerR regulator
MAELKQISLFFDAPHQEPPAAPAEQMTPLPARENRTTAPEAKKQAKRGRLSLKDRENEGGDPDIPEAGILYQKQYYSIGQVAEMFHVNQSLIRMWSNEFEAFIQPRKNKKGDRYFRPDDVKTLELIHHLLRKRKFTMEGARSFLRKNKHAEERFALLQSLQKIKEFLLEMKAGL